MAPSGDGQSRHISRQYNLELDEVKAHLLEMGGVVEKQLLQALAALDQGDSAIAREVRETDRNVNYMEVAIDEECARILARRQPAARDLRLLIAIGKVNTDLERIGDEASKIAKQAIRLCEAGTDVKAYVDVRQIGARVCDMLHQALNALARLDAHQALSVAREDKQVDREYKIAMRDLQDVMAAEPGHIARSLHVIWVLRALERIGDHARNIAEYVIYLVKGSDVRHIGLKAMAERVEGDGAAG